jgi:hypothetical protein
MEIKQVFLSYWVIGGEFSSLNFHTIDRDTLTVLGPYKVRSDAEEAWKVMSYANKHRANYRVLIAEEPVS